MPVWPERRNSEPCCSAGGREVPQADADCPQVLQRLGRLQLHVAVVRLRWEGESLASEICEQKNNFTVNLKLGQLLGNYKQSSVWNVQTLWSKTNNEI